jgi:methionyl-tRNA formyltransferase
MRLVFMGTPSFAVPSLKAAAAAHDVVAVYSRPDSVSSRGSRALPSPVKAAALELGFDVREPATLRDDVVLDALRALHVDAIVVVAYGLILPIEVIEAARLGAVNVHASLLPRWRGAAPIHRAILAGDERTGVSIMRVEEGLDTGPFCVQRETTVDDKSVHELSEELAELGAAALVEALEALEDGRCRWTAQDETQVTYAEKVRKSEIVLSPDLSAADALLRVRASSRQAPARFSVGGAGVTALTAEVFSAMVGAGTAKTVPEGLALGFSEGALLITRLKPDGKGAMSASDWTRGRRLDGEQSWGGPE